MAHSSKDRNPSAYVLAANFGCKNIMSEYGETLTAATGDGMMTHSGNLRERIVDDHLYASQLADIAAMRSAIGESPLTEEQAKRLSCPSDDLVLEYLAFDEAMILSRMDPEYRSAILETYPDLPELLLEAADSSTELATVLDEITEGCAADALKVFREAPVEFFEYLSAKEAHEVMMALMVSKVNLSELAATPDKELVNA